MTIAEKLKICLKIAGYSFAATTFIVGMLVVAVIFE